MKARPMIVASMLRSLLLLFWLAGLLFSEPKSLHAAMLTAKVGYPQPSGASIPLWVITEARTDHRYGIDVQPIYISGGARLTRLQCLEISRWR